MESTPAGRTGDAPAVRAPAHGPPACRHPGRPRKSRQGERRPARPPVRDPSGAAPDRPPGHPDLPSRPPPDPSPPTGTRTSLGAIARSRACRRAASHSMAHGDPESAGGATQPPPCRLPPARRPRIALAAPAHQRVGTAEPPTDGAGTGCTASIPTPMDLARRSARSGDIPPQHRNPTGWPHPVARPSARSRPKRLHLRIVRRSTPPDRTRRPEPDLSQPGHRLAGPPFSTNHVRHPQGR
jgi:hypothetical protein